MRRSALAFCLLATVIGLGFDLTTLAQARLTCQTCEAVFNQCILRSNNRGFTPMQRADAATECRGNQRQCLQHCGH